MKIYLKSVVTILFLILMFGIVLPFIISQESDFMVWIGICIIPLIPIIIFLVWKNEIKQIKEKLKNEKD